MKIEDFDTPEHAAFVAKYFKLNMNGTRAYLAVYGEDLDYMGAAASASRLLKNAKVSAAIKAELRNRIMEADEILARLSEMGKAAHSEYIKDDGTVDIKRMVQDGKAHLIKGIKRTKYGDVYEFHDTKSALELHGKYYALWKDKFEIEVSPLESETLQFLKNGDVTPEQVLKVLGDNDRTRQLIASIK
jgi:hypothetical protein